MVMSSSPGLLHQRRADCCSVDRSEEILNAQRSKPERQQTTFIDVTVIILILYFHTLYLPKMNSLTILFKEFASINRSTTYLDQARIEFPNGEEDPLNLRVIISPTTGYETSLRCKKQLI